MSKNSWVGDFPSGPGVKTPNAGGTCHIARPKKIFKWETVGNGDVMPSGKGGNSTRAKLSHKEGLEGTIWNSRTRSDTARWWKQAADLCKRAVSRSQSLPSTLWGLEPWGQQPRVLWLEPEQAIWTMSPKIWDCVFCWWLRTWSRFWPWGQLPWAAVASLRASLLLLFSPSVMSESLWPHGV